MTREPEFISESIEPEKGSFTTDLMAIGLASLPGAFRWRGRRYVVAECLDHRKVSAPEVTGEIYLRRQQFTVRLESGETAVLYVERHARAGVSRAAAKRRWFLYTIDRASADPLNP